MNTFHLLAARTLTLRSLAKTRINKQCFVNLNAIRQSSASSPLFVGTSLTEDQTVFQESIHKFFAKELTPQLAAKIDQADHHENFKQLWIDIGSLGLHGITAESKYGGLELGYLEHCLAVEAMSQYSAALALSYGAHSNLCINQLSLHGSIEQKERFLPKLIDGTFVGALAMSEPSAGSDVTSMQTSAEKKGDYYLLNGSKFWITNGPISDVVMVYAKTDHGITAFLVEKEFEGFSVGKKIVKMGMRGSPTGELIFQDCNVPSRNIVGELDKGVYVLMSGLAYERLVLAAGPLGIMQRACDVAFEYANERKQFGKKIGEFQLIQGKMADMYTETLFCRAGLYESARCLDAVKSKDSKLKLSKSATNARCAAVILKCAETATKLAQEAVQILGGNGYTEDYEASRLYRDAKLYEIGAGTSEIRRWLIGREINNSFA